MDKQELKLAARILENLPIISSGVMQGWIDNPKSLKQFLSGLASEETQSAYSGYFKTTIIIPTKVAGRKSSPLDFFKNRVGLGLRLSNEFQNFILAAATKSAVETSDTNIGYAELARAANDFKIGAVLPEGYIFEDIDSFLSHLAFLIENQWGGKDGVLLSTNYRANIFYVKGVKGETFAVSILWFFNDEEYACIHEWRCSAFRFGVGGPWRIDDRIFSATTPLN